MCRKPLLASARFKMTERTRHDFPHPGGPETTTHDETGSFFNENKQGYYC